MEKKLPDMSDIAYEASFDNIQTKPLRKEDLPVGQLVQADNKGIRFSKGKLRYDLFPPEALEEIVRVYTRGAEKYTTKWQNGIEGLWQSVPNVKRLDLYLAGTCVVTVMKSGSEIKILSLPRNSDKIVENGKISTQIKLETVGSWTELNEKLQNISQVEETLIIQQNLQNSVSQQKVTSYAVKKDAISAAEQQIYTLIMTMKQKSSEEYYVASATTVWDSLEIMYQDLKGRLLTLNLCDIIQRTGERNWERGMKWSECLRALKSHMTKWEKGEVFDDELTDCRHLAMVAWNAIALLVYEMRGIGENNIPGQQDDISLVPAPGRMSITGLPSLIANPTKTLPSVIEKKKPIPTAISSEMIREAEDILRQAAKNPMVEPATLTESATMDKVVDILSVVGRNERE